MSWMVCSSCRKPIGYGAKYFECSVSTCNRARVRLVFCSVGCWDVHLPEAHHREAWAVEAEAPRSAGAVPPAPPPAARAPAPSPSPPRPASPVAPSAPPAPGRLAAADEDDVLIVVSK